MSSKLIIGMEPWLSMAADDWARVDPGMTLICREISLDNSYRFNLDSILDHDPENVTGFVAWDSKFLNFQRLELMGEFKKRGFKMPALVHPSAQVSASAKYQENVWIQAMCVIGPNVFIEVNACIEMGARIGAQSKVGKSTWIGQDARLGVCVKVGNNSILGPGLTVTDNIQIGRQVWIQTLEVIDKDLPDKTFSLQASKLQGYITNSMGNY